MIALDLISKLEKLVGYDERREVILEVGGDGAIHTGQVIGMFEEDGVIILSTERPSP